MLCMLNIAHVFCYATHFGHETLMFLPYGLVCLFQVKPHKTALQTQGI